MLQFVAKKTNVLNRACLNQEPTPACLLRAFHEEHQAREASTKLLWSRTSRTLSTCCSHRRNSSSDSYCIWKLLAKPAVTCFILLPAHWYKHSAGVANCLHSTVGRFSGELFILLWIEGNRIRNNTFKQALLHSSQSSPSPVGMALNQVKLAGTRTKQHRR